MSQAIQDLKDFLSKSPSVVFPDEVLEYVDAIEAENDKMREACAELLRIAEHHDPEWLHWPEMYAELRKLGIEVMA